MKSNCTFLASVGNFVKTQGVVHQRDVTLVGDRGGDNIQGTVGTITILRPSISVKGKEKNKIKNWGIKTLVKPFFKSNNQIEKEKYDVRTNFAVEKGSFRVSFVYHL